MLAEGTQTHMTQQRTLGRGCNCNFTYMITPLLCPTNNYSQRFVLHMNKYQLHFVSWSSTWIDFFFVLIETDNTRHTLTVVMQNYTHWSLCIDIKPFSESLASGGPVPDLQISSLQFTVSYNLLRLHSFWILHMMKHCARGWERLISRVWRAVCLFVTSPKPNAQTAKL